MKPAYQNNKFAAQHAWEGETEAQEEELEGVAKSILKCLGGLVGAFAIIAAAIYW